MIKIVSAAVGFSCVFFAAAPALAEDPVCLSAKPVVLLHGITAQKENMYPMVDVIKTRCPRLFVLDVEVNTWWAKRLTTLGSINYLTKRLRKEVLKHPELKNGFNMIGQSLGGVISRNMIQRFNSDPQGFHAERFITWASPHRGIYGLPIVKEGTWYVELLDAEMWRIAYLPLPQAAASMAQLWHDPAQPSYIEDNQFVPYLNNEKPHANFLLYRENIKSLKKFVVFESPTEDDVIRPTASSSFNFYPPGEHDGPIQPYEETIEYKSDALGIKTLNQSGRFSRVTVNCLHPNFPSDPTVQQLTMDYLGLAPSKRSRATSAFTGEAQQLVVNLVQVKLRTEGEDGMLEEKELLANEIQREADVLLELDVQELDIAKANELRQPLRERFSSQRDSIKSERAFYEGWREAGLPPVRLLPEKR